MCRVDGRFKPQKELLWEGTGVYGVVTCSFAKPSSPTTIASEMEEKFSIQQRDTKPRVS